MEINELYELVMQRFREIETRFMQLELKNVQAESLGEISDNLGQPGSGEEQIGDELADPGWTASQVGGTLNYTSPRMAVTENLLYDARCDCTPPANVWMTQYVPSVVSGYCRVIWYDDPSAGSEITRDALPMWQGNTFRRVLRAPTGAKSVEFSIRILPNSAYGLTSNSVSNFSLRSRVYSVDMEIEQVPTIHWLGEALRITAGLRAWPDPKVSPTVAQVSTASGNLTNGTIYYKIAWADEFGETMASLNSAAVTVDASHKQTLISLPTPPAGITATRIYRTLAGQGYDSEYYLVATVTASATSYQDNVAEADLGLSAPAENTTLTRPVLPTHECWQVGEMACSTTLSRVASSTHLHGEYWEMSGNGAFLRAPGMFLEEGRYRITTVGVKNSGNSMVDYLLSGALVYAGQDWYASSQQLNQAMTVEFVLDNPGWHELTILNNGQNASANGSYYTRLTEVRIDRIGR